MNPKLICCRVMVEELRPFLPPEMAVEVLEIGLHVHPEGLQRRLQQAIDASDGVCDPIYLGYGMCSKAVLGLVARKSRLVLPKADDCIEIFLGSRQARLDELAKEAGTYFLTAGYLTEGTSTILSEAERCIARYGKERGERLVASMMRHYQRLVYIRTSNHEALDLDRRRSKAIADRFDLRYEEIDGAPEWLRRMIAQDWDGQFVVTRPGEKIERTHFQEPEEGSGDGSGNKAEPL